MLHAAGMGAGGMLVTVESKADLTNWHLCWYDVSSADIKAAEGAAVPVPDHTYGIDFCGNTMMPWTTTDFRCADRPYGLYCGDKLVVPGVCGNGIAFLSDGSALVTRYGQSYPGCFNGIPGALIYIPAGLLKV